MEVKTITTSSLLIKFGRLKCFGLKSGVLDCLFGTLISLPSTNIIFRGEYAGRIKDEEK